MDLTVTQQKNMYKILGTFAALQTFVNTFKQESLAIAKTTARCAQYMGALESFESPRKRPSYFSRNL